MISFSAMIKNDLSWTNYIVTYIDAIAGNNICSDSTKQVLLLLEGDLDPIAYSGKKTYLGYQTSEIERKYNGKRIKLNKANIKSFPNLRDFLDKSLEPEDFEYFFNGGDDKKRNRKAFNYVATAVAAYNEKRNKEWNNIDCFGIVDSDHNQHTDYEDEPRIAITETHDVETFLFFCFMDRYFADKINKTHNDKIVDELGKVFLFAWKQGIFQNVSIKNAGVWQDKNPDVLVEEYCTKITYFYFKDMAKHISLYKQDFNLLIKESVDSVLSGAKVIYKKSQWAQKLQDIYEMETALIDDSKVLALIRKWLCDGKSSLNGDEEQLLKEILWNSNGHILSYQFIRCCQENDVYIHPESDKELGEDLARYIYDDIYLSTNPMRKFVKYMEENRYFSFCDE